MQIIATIKSKFNQLQTSVQTNDAAKSLQIASKPNGYGSSVNGGELLMLSLATCYCNDIYREAAKRNINVSNVEVEFTGNFGGEGEPGFNFKYKVHIDADASPSEIEDLIRHTDKVAEIHNTLRKGVEINLIN
jgi:uncharacterized OsmC-like protein